MSPAQPRKCFRLALSLVVATLALSAPSIAVQSAPAVLCSGEVGIRETRWGGLSCPTCVVADESDDSSGLRRSWTGILSVPITGPYVNDGTMESSLSYSGGAVRFRTSVDHTVSYGGGVMISSASASASASVWVRGGPGTPFAYSIDVDAAAQANQGTGIGRGASAGGSALGNAFGPPGFGLSGQGITSNSTTVIDGCTYSFAGNLSSGASSGASLSCVIGCPNVSQDLAFGTCSGGLTITPVDPRVEVSPSRIDFGPVYDRKAETVQLEIRNAGMGQLRGFVGFAGSAIAPLNARGQFQLPGPFPAQIGNTVAFDLGPGEEAHVPVTLRALVRCDSTIEDFSPGPRMGLLEITTNDDTCQTVQVLLSGTGAVAEPIDVRYEEDNTGNGVIRKRIYFGSSSGDVRDLLVSNGLFITPPGIFPVFRVSGFYEELALVNGFVPGGCADPRQVTIIDPFGFCLPRMKRQPQRLSFVRIVGPNRAYFRDQHGPDGTGIPSAAAAAASGAGSYARHQQWYYDGCDGPAIPVGGRNVIIKGVRPAATGSGFEYFVSHQGNGLNVESTVPLN